MQNILMSPPLTAAYATASRHTYIRRIHTYILACTLIVTHHRALSIKTFHSLLYIAFD